MSTGSRLRTVLLTMFVAVLATFGVAGIASAATSSQSQPQPILASAAKALRSDYVYVHPNITNAGLTNDHVDTLTDMIENGKGKHPVFIAVLPATVINEVRGIEAQLPKRLYELTNREGVFVVWADTPDGGMVTYSTPSSGVPQALKISSASYKKGDAFGSLETFVKDVEEVPLAVNSVAIAKPFPWVWAIGIPVVLLVVLGLLAFLTVNRRKLTGDKEALERKLTSLQNDIFDLPVYANSAAITALEKARRLLSSAQELIKTANTRPDLNEVDGLHKQAQASVDEAARLERDGTDKSTAAWTSPSTYRPVGDTLPPYSGTSELTDEVSAHRPQPRRTVRVANHYDPSFYDSGYSGRYYSNNYPGYGYGDYGDRGWGYYDRNNSFVEGMLLGALISGSVHSHDELVIDNPEYHDDSSDDGPDATGASSVSGGFGDDRTDSDIIAADVVDEEVSVSGDFGDDTADGDATTARVDEETSVSGDFGGDDSPHESTSGRHHTDSSSHADADTSTSGDFGAADSGHSYEPTPVHYEPPAEQRYEPAPHSEPAPRYDPPTPHYDPPSYDPPSSGGSDYSGGSSGGSYGGE